MRQPERGWADALAFIIERTQVDEVHGSAATFRRSQMKCILDEAKVGEGDDFSLKITDGEAVRQLKAAIKTFQD